MAEMVQTDVLIIGAGLAGLNAARVLKDAGIAAVVVDKGTSVGGRMATRRIGGGLADHGAQFFTVRDDTFRQMVDGWIASGLVFEWSRGWSDGSLADTRDGHPRYAVKGGMNALTKFLAQDLDTRVDVKVTAVTNSEVGWRVDDANGGVYHARAVLLTSPVPQSLALLEAGHVNLTADDRNGLDEVEYEPCIVGLFLIDGELHLPPPGAIQRPHVPIQWLGDNRRKGISDVTVLTAQASSAYTHQMWDRADAEILTAMRIDIMPFLGEASVVDAQIKRWKYSMPSVLYPERCLFASGLTEPRILAFAGDAFGGPRVEGAVMSGLTAGRELVARLK